MTEGRMTQAQLSIMRLLAQSPNLTISELARKLQKSRSSISETLAVLMRKGLVTRYPSIIIYQGREHEAYGYCYHYRLTELGYELLNVDMPGKAIAIPRTKTYISYTQAQEWGRQGAYLRHTLKEAWMPFRRMRKRMLEARKPY